MKQLDAIAITSTSRPDSVVRSLIAETMKPIQTAKELELAAVLAYQIAFPQSAGDIAYDRVFDAAFWSCIEKLSRIRGAESTYTLDRIVRRCNLEAGDKMRLNEYRDAQMRLH
jgi:hypothetical protein